MNKESGKILLVLGDPFSARVFSSSGIIDRLHGALGRRLKIIAISRNIDLQEWMARDDVTEPLFEDDLIASRKRSLWQRVHARIDNILNSHIGFYPLAIRFNLRHGFHIERMEPGHNNWFLDNARIGFLPKWDRLYRMMFWWLFSFLRYVDPGIMGLLSKGVDTIVLSNLQHPAINSYLVAARKYKVPVLGYVASWDHLVGKGVVYPYCTRYIVQNKQMEDEISRLHGISTDRVTVTGWPQTDIFAQPRSHKDFEVLLESFGLLAVRKRCVLVTGNTETNAPYEPLFIERLVQWWQETGSDQIFNLIFRPHPKDTNWQQRFANVAESPSFYIQPPSYTDMDVLALMLQHVDCIVTNAGTVMLEGIINQRSVVCVLYDEGTPETGQFAHKNVLGEHYRDLLETEVFYRAENFQEVTQAIERSLKKPNELAEEQRIVAKKVVGIIDGKAAERVAETMLSEIRKSALQ